MEIFNTLTLSKDDKKNYVKAVDEFEKYANPRKKRLRKISKKQDQDQLSSTELKKLATSCEFEQQKDSLIVTKLC